MEFAMSDQSDEGQSVALGVAGLALALVIAGVLALAIGHGKGGKAAPAATAPAVTAVAAPAVAAAPVTAAMPAAAATAAAVERLYFEVGSAALPADAAEVLKRVAEQASAKAGAKLRISGFHDASGDPARNAELAKDRAMAVRQALESQGVAAASLVMSKPEVTTGGADPREARRVELRLE
jgi:outer membrane protein OmpA-like peptidoglycan-associated protein